MYSINTNKIGVLIHAKDIDSKAYDQIKIIKKHPSMRGLIAIMPDIHAGADCVIGFTGTFNKSVIPNIVGVDIGCGVITYKLPKNVDLNLPLLYAFIENNIPTGFNKHNKAMRFDFNQKFTIKECEQLVKTLNLKANPTLQAGTLGGGNHFIEVEHSPTTHDTYVTIHSGSRKFGLEIAKHHQEKAKLLMNEMNISVPKGLEYLPMNLGGNEYIKNMYLAQDYASLNRRLMLMSILKYLDVKYDAVHLTESVHNYISERDNIVRKGAISAHKNTKVVIPLNMGKNGGIILGRGLGNKDYNFSAPHGAGRIFARNVLKRQLKSGEISMKMFKDSMEGIYSNSVTEQTIDEAPLAYKPLPSIEEHLKETVEIVDIARPIMSFKSIN